MKQRLRGQPNGRALELFAALSAVCLFAGGDWLQFRGTDNNSVSDERNLPRSFDPATGENIAWKVPLPGRGPSSPIVVAGRVVVTAASGPRQDRLHVLVFDAGNGRLRWHRQLWATGHTVCNAFGGVAGPTPASNGRLIFVLFSSNDLACFDLNGNLKWTRGLAYENPTTRNDVGMASSPLVIGDRVIVQLENQGESFAAGIDVHTGQTVWRIARPQKAIWASPTRLHCNGAQDDVFLMQSYRRLSAHDPCTGRILWDYPISCHTIASATTSDGCVYLPANGLHALRPRASRGDVELLWHQLRLRSGNSSPVVHRGRAYTIKPPAILVCGDTNDGRVLWQLRLEGPIWATPVLADGRLYCVSHDGLVQVVQLGQRGKLVGTGRIDQDILASPAVAERALYFRSNAYLWKIERHPATGPRSDD